MNNSYCGFWKRLFAYVIDYMISFYLCLFVILSVGVVALGFCSHFLGTSLRGNVFKMDFSCLGLDVSLHGNWLHVFFSVSGLLVIWLYDAFFHSSKYQATPGLMLVGGKITDLDGKRISFLKATARFWSMLLSMFLFFIGVIMIGCTRKKQGLHDLIAGTLVRKEKT